MGFRRLLCGILLSASVIGIAPVHANPTPNCDPGTECGQVLELVGRLGDEVDNARDEIVQIATDRINNIEDFDTAAVSDGFSEAGAKCTDSQTDFATCAGAVLAAVALILYMFWH
jgi:hypothetical protein